MKEEASTGSRGPTTFSRPSRSQQPEVCVSVSVHLCFCVLFPPLLGRACNLHSGASQRCKANHL